MEFDQEFEYEQDYPYVVDDEITEQYPTDEEDSSWPHFCQGCGFAILDCVCVNDECPTCGGDIVNCACTLEWRRWREERVLERLYCQS